MYHTYWKAASLTSLKHLSSPLLESNQGPPLYTVLVRYSLVVISLSFLNLLVACMSAFEKFFNPLNSRKLIIPFSTWHYQYWMVKVSYITYLLEDSLSFNFHFCVTAFNSFGHFCSYTAWTSTLSLTQE